MLDLFKSFWQFLVPPDRRSDEHRRHDAFLRRFAARALRQPNVLKVERRGSDFSEIHLIGKSLVNNQIIDLTDLLPYADKLDETQLDEAFDTLLQGKKLTSLPHLNIQPRAALSSSSGHERAWAAAKDGLCTILRGYHFRGTLDREYVNQPFTPLLRLYVADEGLGVHRMVRRAKLDDWGKSEEQIHHIAMAALLQLAKNDSTEVAFPHADFKSFKISGPPGRFASRLAIAGYLKKFDEKVGGKAIAIAPHPDMLVIADSGNHAAVIALAHLAEREFSSTSLPISPALYTTDNEGRVIPFSLPSDHPCFHIVERGRKLLTVSVYRSQYTPLDRELKDTHSETTVAVCEAKIDDDKQITLVANWLDNSDTLFPPVDEIHCHQSNNPEAVEIISWIEFIERCGENLQVIDEYGARRYRSGSTRVDESTSLSES